MEKGFGEWLSGLILTLAGMAGAYGLALAFIKNLGIKKKKLESLETENNQLKGKLEDQEKEIDELKGRCQIIEKNFHEFMMFQLGRK